MFNKKEGHFMNWYLFQTAITSMIFGYLSVDKTYHGWDLLYSSLLLAVMYFTIIIMIANDFMEKDEKRQRRAEIIRNISKKRNKKSA